MRISFPAVKALASVMGANYQRAIQEILTVRENELEEHHNQLLIGSRHNARVSHKDSILQAVARDFLHLENWQDVTY